MPRMAHITQNNKTKQQQLKPHTQTDTKQNKNISNHDMKNTNNKIPFVFITTFMIVSPS